MQGNKCLVFDPRGFSQSSTTVNFCLYTNTSYFVVSYDTRIRNVPHTVYTVDGQVVKVIEEERTWESALYPMLSHNDISTASAVLKQGSQMLMYPAPPTGCNSTNEVLLDMITSPETSFQEAGIYDMEGRAIWLTPSFTHARVTPVCAPNNQQYVLVAFSFISGATTNYTITVDGLPRVVVHGPFYKQFPNIPHCSMTLLTPALLAGFDEGKPEGPSWFPSTPPSNTPSLRTTTVFPTSEEMAPSWGPSISPSSAAPSKRTAPVFPSSDVVPSFSPMVPTEDTLGSTSLRPIQEGTTSSALGLLSRSYVVTMPFMVAVSLLLQCLL